MLLIILILHAIVYIRAVFFYCFFILIVIILSFLLVIIQRELPLLVQILLLLLFEESILFILFFDPERLLPHLFVFLEHLLVVHVPDVLEDPQFYHDLHFDTAELERTIRQARDQKEVYEKEGVVQGHVFLLPTLLVLDD